MAALWMVLFALCCCLGVHRGVAQGNLVNQGALVDGKIKLLWPIHISSMPFSTPQSSSLETPEFGKALAVIGINGFTRFVESILPKMLEKDEQFAKEFRESDHSRINLAFLTYQRHVFAQKHNIPVDSLTGRGDPMPKLEGIDYTWPEFYESPLYTRLLHRFNQVSKLYLRRTGYKQVPKHLRIFTWVEIYNKGDAQRPWARTDGAYLMGRYFAQATQGALKFNFEDPRGINPPYGKTYSHAAFEGNLITFPTWLSHFITPNIMNRTQVCFAFIAYPPDGNTLDWEADETGALIVTQNVRIDRKGMGFHVDDRLVMSE